MAKTLYALGCGVIVSTSIALWDQVLLLLARGRGSIPEVSGLTSGRALPGIDAEGLP